VRSGSIKGSNIISVEPNNNMSLYLRINICCLILLTARNSFSVAWEKIVAPGVTYRTEIQPEIPRVIHTLCIFAGSDKTQLKTHLTRKHLIPIETQRGDGLVSATTKRESAIAGINADYFPLANRIPIGVMVKDGELLSTPFFGRSVFGWGSKTRQIGMLAWEGKITPEGREPIKLTGFNEVCKQNRIVLNTHAVGKAVAEPMCLYLRVQIGDQKIAPSGKIEGLVLGLHVDKPFVFVPKGEVVIAVKGLQGALLSSLPVGHRITIEAQTKGLDWTNVDHAIGGGPNLCRNGKVCIDAKEQKFKPDVVNGRSPRSAVGFNQFGDIMLVIVDGRSCKSKGATLNEMAEIMLNLGCSDAMNLDGGGSSSLSLFGKTFNSPSDKTERRVANGLFAHSNVIPQSKLPIKIIGNKNTTVGLSENYIVVDSQNNQIPHSQLHWRSNSKVAVDQNGSATFLEPGKGLVEAYYGQQNVEIVIAIASPNLDVVIASTNGKPD
jgi:hypothetical protein